eukprot:m.124814 g.124814  ORF g.124814 m.124814 type:complete len:102 (+) comp15722_c0_seq1:18-323(+)
MRWHFERLLSPRLNHFLVNLYHGVSASPPSSPSFSFPRALQPGKQSAQSMSTGASQQEHVGYFALSGGQGAADPTFFAANLRFSSGYSPNLPSNIEQRHSG